MRVGELVRVGRVCANSRVVTSGVSRFILTSMTLKIWSMSILSLFIW